MMVNMTIRLPIYLFSTLFLLALYGCGRPVIKPVQTPAYTGATSEQVIKIARSMLGTPYRYGGRSPKTGFDCSGLVYFSFLQIGITLPRTSQGQFSSSTPIAKTAIQRGDLLFFRINRRKISHVGIYLGNNRFVHSPSPGKKVSIAKLDSPYWRKRFARGGRIKLN